MSYEHDHQMAAGLRAGKSEAWSALYEEYFDRVWQLAARMIGPDAAVVADVVQETFLDAARSARTFDPGRGPLWLWLAGAVRNHVAAHFRSQHRFGRVLAGGDLHPAIAGQLADRLRQGTPTPHAGCIEKEEAALVRGTLAGLGDDYQSLLTARYLEDVPVEEIARLADCTVTAVRSKLARARQAFREAFLIAGANHERE
jgi:RNA polymerase sigma-70 factor (ECF subfamily)